jgi:hypothetical protein
MGTVCVFSTDVTSSMKIVWRRPFWFASVRYNRCAGNSSRVLLVCVSNSVPRRQDVWVGPESPLQWAGICFSVGPTQPPVQWVLAAKRPGREGDLSPRPGFEVRNEWSYASTAPIRLHGVYRGDLPLAANVNHGYRVLCCSVSGSNIEGWRTGRHGHLRVHFVRLGGTDTEETDFKQFHAT